VLRNALAPVENPVLWQWIFLYEVAYEVQNPIDWNKIPD